MKRGNRRKIISAIFEKAGHRKKSHSGRGEAEEGEKKTLTGGGKTAREKRPRCKRVVSSLGCFYKGGSKASENSLKKPRGEVGKGKLNRGIAAKRKTTPPRERVRDKVHLTTA